MNKEYKTKSAYIKKCIGGNIRRIRLNNNIEVKQLCSDLELSPAAYSNIERGVTDISISRIVQLADYFEVHYILMLSANDVNIDQIAQNSNNEFTQHNKQTDTVNADNFQFLIEQIKTENLYLKEKVSQLLNMLGTIKIISLKS